MEPYLERGALSRVRAVAVISSRADAELAGLIADELVRQGHRVVQPGGEVPGEPDSAVVVVSSSAVLEELWRRQVDAVRGLRVIPVQVGQVEDSAVPEFLRELNWVLWDAAPRAKTSAEIMLALGTELRDYQSSRSLETQARIWQAQARAQDCLIEGVGPARAALGTLDRSASSVAPGSDLTRAFVEASLAAAIRGRRRRWTRRTVWTLMVATSLAVFALLALEFRGGTPSAGQAIGVQLSPLDHDRPDLVALKAVGLVESLTRTGVEPDAVVGLRLAQALSEPWSSGPVAANHDSPVNAVAFTEEANRVVFADGLGRVSWFDLDTGDEETSLTFASEPLFEVATDSSGSFIVASGSSSVFVGTRGQVSPVQEVQVDGQIAEVRVDPRARFFVVATSDGRLLVADSDPSVPRFDTVGPFDSILDISVNEETSLALVREGDRLSIVELPTGATVQAVDMPEQPFEVGALGRGGVGVAFRGAGDQLWFGEDLSALLPTGIPFVAPVEDVAVADGGVVVLASGVNGAHAVHAPLGLRLGRICRELGVVREVLVSPDASRIACNSNRGIVTQVLEGLAPEGHGPDGAHVAGLARAGGAGPLIEVGETPGGAVEVTWQAGPEAAVVTQLIDPMGVLGKALDDASGRAVLEVPGLGLQSPVSILSISSDGGTVRLGSESGEVRELDLTPSPGPASIGLAGDLTLVSMWTSPDRTSVVRIEERPDGALEVTTASGLVWRVRSCAGCASRGGFLPQVAARLWPCYSDPGALSLLSGELAAAMGLRECEPTPGAGHEG